MASATAVMVAALALLARLFRAGAVVNFISEPVLIGFKCGVALYLASSQLPKLCGIKGGHGDFWEKSADFIRHAGETNPTSLLMGGAALALLLFGKTFPARQTGGAGGGDRRTVVRCECRSRGARRENARRGAAGAAAIRLRHAGPRATSTRCCRWRWPASC